MQIQIEDLTRPDTQTFLYEHLADMHRNSPLGSVNAFDLSGLQAEDITFWTVRESEQLMGCGALRQLSPTAGEIKSMRTAIAHRRRGVAATLLEHMLTEAKRRGYRSVSLETGSTAPFQPAIALYKRFGFESCRSFAGYEDTDFNLFMTLELS